MSLLSDKQLAALSKIAERGMKTPVSIQRRSTVETVLESAADRWTTIGTAVGWLRALPSDSVSYDVGNIHVSVSYRLFLPLGTDVLAHDRVIIGGEDYQVLDTNVENTWKVLLRCSLRKGE